MNLLQVYFLRIYHLKLNRMPFRMKKLFRMVTLGLVRIFQEITFNTNHVYVSFCFVEI